jgi:glycosidase
VILDGVFNHTGRKFHAFKELVALGKDWEKSQYKDWYFLSEGESTYGDAFAYRSWEGHEELPELNVENKDVREYLFKVGKFWLEMGVDGWRLDVAHELPPAFWRDFRTACSEANPEHVLLGEVIHGDYNTWVGPTKGLLHSGTNYQLSKALWSSLRDKNFWELNTSLQRDLTLYRDMCLVNFLSNHDVARVATQLEQEPRLNILAHFLLMTTRGVPCIYYGDEAAERGKKEDGDAALRNKMVDIAGEWPAGGKELYNYLQALIKLRSTSEPLVAGSQTVLYFSNTDFIFLRQTDQGEMVVVAANCDKEHANVEVEMGVLSRPPGTALRCIWGDGADAGAISEEYKIRIHIPPFTGRIFKVESPEKPKEEATDGATAEGEAPADEAAPTFTRDGDE